jgi:hypothetical protein
MKSRGEVNGIRVDAELIEHLEKQHAEPEDSMTGVLRVVVPYTTSDLTRVALRHTAVCSDLDVCVCLVDVQAVPFPCSFDQPLLFDKEYSRDRLREEAMVANAGGKTRLRSEERRT